MKRFLLLPLAGLLLVGCPHRVGGPNAEVGSAAQMLAILAKQDARFGSMQGEAKLKVHSPSASGSVNQYLSVIRPAGLHIETFNFFGKPVSALVSDGDRFSLYDAEHNIFYEGPATAESMARFLPVPISLPPEEIVALMLAQVPRIPASGGKLVLDTDRQLYILTLQVKDVTQTLEIDARTLDVKRSTVTGVAAYNLTLDDYREEPGGRFPHSVGLEVPSQDVELTYRYADDLKVNAAPDLTLFHQDPPASATVVKLDPAGNPAQQRQP